MLQLKLIKMIKSKLTKKIPTTYWVDINDWRDSTEKYPAGSVYRKTGFKTISDAYIHAKKVKYRDLKDSTPPRLWWEVRDETTDAVKKYGRF